MIHRFVGLLFGRLYVLPNLDYESPIWNPIKKADIHVLERLQRKFTKHLHSLEGLSYTDHLQHLSTDYLEHCH